MGTRVQNKVTPFVKNHPLETQNQRAHSFAVKVLNDVNLKDLLCTPT